MAQPGQWARRTLASCIVALLAVASSLPPAVRGIRFPQNRAKALAKLGEERRIYFNDCSQLNQKTTCLYAIDSGVIRDLTQCAVNLPADNPWWQAELDAPSFVTKVTIVSVKEAYRTLRDALLDISLAANDHVCFHYKSDKPFDQKTFGCDVMADLLTVQSYVKQSVLAICDVEVYGVPLKFPSALGQSQKLKPSSCDQSSTDYRCELALQDGNSCAATLIQSGRGAWFRAYLEKPALIDEVTLKNIGSSLLPTSFTIDINGARCATYDEKTAPRKASFKCAHFGDSVYIESYVVYAALKICKIEIFGHMAGYALEKKFVYLGCYKDKRGDNDLPKFVSTMRMSHDKCYRICKRLGHKYFGIQSGRYCACGDAYGKHGKADKKLCSDKCEDAKHETCGGTLVNSVFQISAPSEEKTKGEAKTEGETKGETKDETKSETKEA